MFYGLLHMDTPVLANQQKLAFISSVRTLDAILTHQERWPVGTDGEIESKNSYKQLNLIYICIYIYIYIYIKRERERERERDVYKQDVS